jgi:hypothetical protein
MDSFVIVFVATLSVIVWALVYKLFIDLNKKPNISPWTFDELVAMTLIAIDFTNGSVLYNKEVSRFCKIYNRELKGVLAKVEDLRDYNQNMNFVFNEKFDKAFDVAVDKIKIY